MFSAFQLNSGALTKLVAASSSTASSATQVCTGNEQGLYLATISTIPIYVAVGSSSVQAACPTTATPCIGLCIPASAPPQHLTVPPQGWLSAATSARRAF